MVRANDLHRVYLQSFLARRVMSQDLALEMYKRAIAACTEHSEDFVDPPEADKAGLTAFIEALNGILEGMGMEIRHMNEETEEARLIYALINTDAAEPNLAGSDYNPLEISYYREIVSAIIASFPANSIGSNQALMLTSELKGNLTKTNAEMLLKSFVARNWLEKSKRGRLSLAPRALMELEVWLRAEFDDYILNCRLCSKICLKGVACGNEDCNAAYHKNCYKSILRGRPKCQTCQAPFNDVPPTPLGEEAAPRYQDESTNTGRNKRKRLPKGKGKGKGRASNVTNGDDLESEEGEGEGEETDQDDGGDGEDDSQDIAEGSSESVIVQAGSGPSKWAARASGRTVIPETQDDDDDEEEEEEQPRRRSRR